MDITHIVAAGLDVFPGYWRYVAQAALSVGVTVALDATVRTWWARRRRSGGERGPWAGGPPEGRVVIGLSGLTFAWLPTARASDECHLAVPSRADTGLTVYRLVVWQ